MIFMQLSELSLLLHLDPGDEGGGPGDLMLTPAPDCLLGAGVEVQEGGAGDLLGPGDLALLTGPGDLPPRDPEYLQPIRYKYCFVSTNQRSETTNNQDVLVSVNQ